MITNSAAEARQLVLAQDVMTRKLRRMALAVPAIAVVVGTIGAVIQLRFMLFSVSLIFGWTQLVGL
jgi:hypothetical protein